MPDKRAKNVVLGNKILNSYKGCSFETKSLNCWCLLHTFAYFTCAFENIALMLLILKWCTVIFIYFVMLLLI